MKVLIRENINISLESIRSQLLRTILTVLIIAIGISALVGILTSIDALKANLKSNFMRMGSNTFSIQNRSMQMGNQRHQSTFYKKISWHEAQEFKKEFTFPSYVSLSTRGTGNATVKYESEKTYPNIRVFGVDENYLVTSGEELSKGRNFSFTEINYGSPVAIIGSDLAETLFKSGQDPVGKIISIGPGRFRVIGVLESKGSSIGFSSDRNCYIPITNLRVYLPGNNLTYNISVLTVDPKQIDGAISEATGLFRTIRGLRSFEENNFSITKSDSMVNMMLENVGMIGLAAVIIGIITLFGAAIGLMNIMLVSVSERTREIGIRKALGATQKIIRNQFLVEAIVIAQIGGLLGVILGIGVGNGVAKMIGGDFIIPWQWMILGFSLCFVVAILSGFIPAYRASKLDPIESLRYE